MAGLGVHPYFSVAAPRDCARTNSALHAPGAPLWVARRGRRGSATLARMDRFPTAPVAAGSLIAGYAVVEASGSRPLGGVVLLAGGIWCMRAWSARRGVPTATRLGVAGLTAFILSHVLALAIGAWPSVLVVSTAMGALTWNVADARTRGAAGTPAAERL